MKYIVVITLYYNNNVRFVFDYAEQAMQFMQLAAEHLTEKCDPDKRTTIYLEVERNEA